jgi:hypothetical protein
MAFEIAPVIVATVNEHFEVGARRGQLLEDRFHAHVLRQTAKTKRGAA